MSAGPVMSTIFAAIGLVAVVLQSIRMYRMARAMDCARRTTGRVVRLEPDADGDGYTAVVEVRTDDRTFEVRSPYGQGGMYRVGETVTVYYDPGRPEKGWIVGTREWVAAWVGLAAGLAFVIFGVIAFGLLRE